MLVGMAAREMRVALIDHARRKHAKKRDGSASPVSGRVAPVDRDAFDTLDLLALEESLKLLGAADERAATVVALRFFAGMSVQQAADALGVSVSTVESDWRAARAWLGARLSVDVPAPGKRP